MKTLEEMVDHVLASEKTPALYDEMMLWANETFASSLVDASAIVMLTTIAEGMSILEIARAGRRKETSAFIKHIAEVCCSSPDASAIRPLQDQAKARLAPILLAKGIEIPPPPPPDYG